MKVLAFVLSLLSAPAFAGSPKVAADLQGEYARPSAVRFFGDYTGATCKDEGGALTDGACIIPSTDTLSIKTNDSGDTVVGIEVVFGPANQRSFDGVVTSAHGGKLIAQEADIDEDGSVGAITKNGCKVVINVAGGVANVKVGKTCDMDLGRVDGAKKTP